MFFNQEKFLLTKIPQMLYDLMVLKFWLLNVQDKLLGFFSLAQAHPHPLPLSSPSFHLYILSISINNGSDGDGDGDDTGNRRGTHFLEKKLFFSSRIEFFVCFFGSVLYYVDCVYD